MIAEVSQRVDPEVIGRLQVAVIVLAGVVIIGVLWEIMMKGRR